MNKHTSNSRKVLKILWKQIDFVSALEWVPSAPIRAEASIAKQALNASSSPASSGTCWHSNYDQTRQFNSDYKQHGIRSYIYTDLLVCRSVPEVNREISIWKLESTVLEILSLIWGVLFLLSAQITELFTVFLHPYSKFFLILATFMQTLLPVVKLQSSYGCQRNPPH